MANIKGVRAAKDYLANLIAEQAEREGAPLTEVERKMLYFTEDGGLSKEMSAVNAEFDRDFDQDAYERRINRLYARFVDRDDIDRDTLGSALKGLGDGDNYLNILIGAPSEPGSPGSPKWERFKAWLPSDRLTKNPRDILRVVGLAVVLSAVCILFILFKEWLVALYDSWHSPYR